MFLDWLPDVLRDAGVPIFVDPGAETRTSRASGLTVVHGVVWHHTATSTAWSDGHVIALLRDGRRDLSGPLSQVGPERSGVWNIIALGRANHNGYGLWGNDSIGLEFFNAGTGEPFTAKQYDNGVIGTAAILRHLGLSAAQVLGHKETDPSRKIDPTLDMGLTRLDVASLLQSPPPPPVLPGSLVGMDIYHVIESDRYYVILPWGVTRLDPAVVYTVDNRPGNETSVQVVHLTLAEWNAYTAGAA